MLDNSAWDRIGDLLIDTDFYRYEHRLIYAVIGGLINAMKPADVVTVYAQLQAQGNADKAGGLEYLNALAQYVPSSSNIRRYAEIIRERSVLRNLVIAGDEIVASAFNPGLKPVADLIDDAEMKIMAIGELGQKGKRTYVSMEEAVVGVLDYVQEASERDSPLVGTSTGFADLDKITSGMQSGDLIVIAGRPSMGKTSLAMNIAEHIALNEGLPTAVFSMEMSAQQLALRVIGSVGRIDQGRLMTGKLHNEEWPRLTEAVEKMRNCVIDIDETPGMTVGGIRAAARRAARRHGKLGLVVVDYLQLMGEAGEENRATELGLISRGLKALAKELDCPVIALSQLNRSVEARSDKRPVMSDLRESGAIEQDADVIMFIYRDDYYNKDSKEPGVAEVIISKQRKGPTGMVKMLFLKPLTKFENLARGY